MSDEVPALQGKKRILLIVSLFPPDQNVGSLRWARLGRVLSARGYEFDIVAGDSTIFQVPQGGASFFEPNSLTRVKYPLDALTFRVLLKKRFGRTSSPGAALRGIAQVSSPVPKETNRLLKHCKRLLKFLLVLSVFPGFSAKWGKHAAVVGVALVKKRKIDIVIASHPYMACLNAGRAIAEETRVPWIADLRDPWANNHQSLFLGTPFLHQLLRRIERRTLSTAAAVVTINRQLSKLLCVESDRVTIIPNSFDPAEAPSPKLSRSPPGDIVNIVYTGTLLEKLQYRILMDSLAQCVAEGVSLPLKIHYYGASSALLLSSAGEAGASLNYFEDHGLVSHQEVLRVMTEADLLLLFGWRGQSGECVVTGKIFDYLCSKTPIVAVGATPETAMATVLQETGGGTALSSVEETTHFLKDLTSNSDAMLTKLRSMRKEEAVQRYWTTHTASQFEMLIDSVLQQRDRATPK